MGNQDRVNKETQEIRLISDHRIGLDQSHHPNLVIHQLSSALRSEQIQGSDQNIGGAADDNGLGLGQSIICNGYFDTPEAMTPQSQDVEYRGKYEQCSEHESKYNVVIDHKFLNGESSESRIDQDDIALVNDGQQIDLTSQGDKLSFGNSDLPIIEESDIDMSMLQPEYVMTSPIVQSRMAIPALVQQLHVGQEFPDVQSCRRALRDLAIAMHFEIQTVKSDKSRFTAKCASEGCPWRVHAAKLSDVPTFTIRTIHTEHKCVGIDHLGHQQASVQWVASSVEQRLMDNPQVKPKEILEDIHREYGITLSYKQAWRGKERFMASIRGSFEDDYRLLPQYCSQVQQTNPGSLALVCVNPVDNSFERLFISYQASIYGFLNGCQPLLGLDRTALKNKYLGTLLFAAGFDGDRGVFPLAFGVVDEENDETWMWFLSELHNLLDMNTDNMPRLTFLSDRRNSIVNAVEVNFPSAFHGFCMLHLTESFRKEFNNNDLVSLLWEAAHAPTVMEFETKLLEIEEISHDAAYWVQRVPADLWSNAHFEGTRYGNMTANIAEMLSSWISESCGLPIVQMMESIRRQLMILFNERREASMQWTSVLVPCADGHVTEALKCAQMYQVLRENDTEFKVVSHEGQSTVDVRGRCCLCRGWQTYGLPCSHAVAALLSCRQNVHRFTENCFMVASYREAYSQTIHPVPDRALWQHENEQCVRDMVVKPPKSLKPPPAQPRKRRASQSGDRGQVKRVVHCSRCYQTGHFRTTCATPI